MTYFQFIHAVETKVKKEVKSDKNVSVHTNVKNNGVKRSGLMISENGINISPTIYLEEYFSQFRKGYPLEQIAKDIVRLYERIRFQNSWKDGEKIRDYDYIKERIVYRLINKEENEDLLRETPYREYMDLAIVYYVLLEVDECGMASMMVKEEHLKMWKVTEEDLYYRACKNTQRLMPYEFAPMRSVIEELIGLEADETPVEKMYVLSNEMRSYGACAILYPDRLREIGEEVGENYYVIPSSVHETIIVAESEAPDKETLCGMIEEINETQVEAEEVLSDRAYYYDRNTGRLIL